jgi:hypothetical protein
MSDIPIDTLFIVGLLIASFVGKLLEGRAKRKKESPVDSLPKSNKRERELTDSKNLDDLLRETFTEVVEPNLKEDIPFIEKRDAAFNSKAAYKTDILVTPSKSNKYSSRLDGALQKEDPKSSKVWIRTEGLKSNQNLRRAFLLKEILGKPPGLN